MHDYIVLGVYIGILVISTTTGHGGSVVIVHLLPKQKVGVHFPVVTEVFFPTSIFLSPLSNLSQTKQMNHQSVIDTPT